MVAYFENSTFSNIIEMVALDCIPTLLAAGSCWADGC
jgi:hypothetical protein